MSVVQSNYSSFTYCNQELEIVAELFFFNFIYLFSAVNDILNHMVRKQERVLVLLLLPYDISVLLLLNL